MDIKEFLELKAAKEKELQKLLEKEGKEMLDQLFAPVLDAGLEVRWQQYTPYFNDGDACTFRVGEPEFRVTGKEEDDEDFHEAYSFTCEPKHEWHIPGYTKVINDFESKFGHMEDVFEALWGDHVQITVTRAKRGKINFEIDEYSHE